MGRVHGLWCKPPLSQDPSDSKSNRLHVDDIFRFCFHSFEVYSTINSSKMIGNSHEVSTSTGYFSNSTGSSAPNRRFSPSIGGGHVNLPLAILGQHPSLALSFRPRCSILLKPQEWTYEGPRFTTLRVA